MKFLKDFKLNFLNILKVAGVVLIVIVLISVVFRLTEPVFRSVMSQSRNGIVPMMSYDMDEMAYDKSDSRMMSAESTIGGGMPYYDEGSVSGDTAEDYEVTSHNISYESRDSENECMAVANLKSLDYVIFENSNGYEQGCSFTFKVEHSHVDEVLVTLEDLDPENISQNTYTIKGSVDRANTELDIYSKKKASIEETLEDAIRAYDDLIASASNADDFASLAKIIDSKIQIIERLSQEQINIDTYLNRYEKSKADQLDRLNYTYFYVNVYESKYFDFEELRNSWKFAIKDVVRDVNGAIQGATVKLVTFVFFVVQYALYLVILLFVAKFGWRFAKYVWKK